MSDFSYFDQFSDTEIDLTSYLMNVSTSAYNYRLSNNQPVKTNIKNLFTHYEIIQSYKTNAQIIFNYQVSGNDTPEVVSQNVYGSSDYWWIILLFNDIVSPLRDWILDQTQLTQFVDSMYNDEGKYDRETYYNFLFEQNEDKRTLILPEPYILPDIIWAFRSQILGIS